MAKRRKLNIKQFFRDYPIVPVIAVVFAIGVVVGFGLGQKTAHLQKIPASKWMGERPAEAHMELAQPFQPAPEARISESQPLPVQKAETAVQPKVLFPFFTKKTGPRLAIVIDDVGNNRIYADLLFDMGAPLTLAILPHLPYSKFFAEEAKKREIATLLHLPLEPDDEWYSVGEGEIKVTMGDEKIREILNGNLESVPYVTGVNNHMGSKATRNARVMSVILSELKNRNLFFLDSMTHPNSVGYEKARALGLKTAKRDVFLDNTDEYDYVRDQIRQACKIAKSHGSAIAIGHVRENTLTAIRDALPAIQAQGIELVNLKDLI